MDFFENFLKTNGLTLAEIAKFLKVSPQYVGQVRNGKGKLSQRSLALLKANEQWDTSMLPDYDDRIFSQSVQNNAPVNRQVNFPTSTNADLWQKLCEEKDKRITELERTIQILLNK